MTTATARLTQQPRRRTALNASDDLPARDRPAESTRKDDEHACLTRPHTHTHTPLWHADGTSAVRAGVFVS